MAGTCNSSRTQDEGITKVVWRWSATSSGGVTGEGAVDGLTGAIAGVVFSTGSVNAYSTLAMVSLLDPGGVDVLTTSIGKLFPKTTAPTHATKYRTPINSDGGYIMLLNDTLTPRVVAAGSSGSGTLTLYLT